MARVPASIYLDEDVSVVVAAILRARGFDATTAGVPASLADRTPSNWPSGRLQAASFLHTTGSTLNACIGTGSKKGGRTQGFSLPGGDLHEMLLPGWADCWLAWVPRT